MATQSDLAAYVQRVRGQYIDVDRVFGAQCWDQWSHYAMWLGVPSWPTYTNAGGTHPHGGYACNVYHNARAAGLDRWFEILPATATPRAGDVAFWEYGSVWYPWSHVATVLQVTKGGRMLRCLTQNPGYTQIADLITSGVIGYLRPKALAVLAPNPNTSKTPTLTASQKTARTTVRRKRRRSTMLIYVHHVGKDLWAIYEHGKPGTWWEFTGSQQQANQLANQLGSAMTLSASTWAERKRAHS